MKRLLVTDSTADIPVNIVKKLGIEVLPVNVVLWTDLQGRAQHDYHCSHGHYDDCCRNRPEKVGRDRIYIPK